MKFYVAEDLGCVYFMNDDDLWYCPISENNTFDPEGDDAGSVEADIVGDEPVTHMGKPMTLNDVYEIVRLNLKS